MEWKLDFRCQLFMFVGFEAFTFLGTWIDILFIWIIILQIFPFPNWSCPALAESWTLKDLDRG